MKAGTLGVRKKLQDIWGYLGQSDGLSARWLQLVFVLAVMVLFLRCTDDLIHPQFCAEDGSRFFAQAYNLGWWRALPLPNAGYMDTIPRLIASLALLVPLRWAPLVANLCGIALQAMPAMVLVSRRAATWGPLQMRALMALLYLLMTNSAPLHVMPVNSPWHLSILTLLIAFSNPPATRLGQLTDVLLLALAATSGPYGIVMMPVLLYHAYFSRSRWHWLQTAIVMAGAVVQCGYLLLTPRGTKPNLGANVPDLLRMIGGNVFLDTIFGGRIPFASRLPMIIIVVAVIVGSITVYFGNKAAPRAMWLFTIFAFLLLAASLYRPLVGSNEPAWRQWVHAHGQRYFYIPVVACTWSLIWAALRSTQVKARQLARFCICFLPIGIASDFHSWNRDFQFPEHARAFERAASGTVVQFEINPGGWMIELKKH